VANSADAYGTMRSCGAGLRRGLRAKQLEGQAILSDNRAIALAREDRMLDKQSASTESAPVLRIEPNGSRRASPS
jgi:hypothetical protein